MGKRLASSQGTPGVGPGEEQWSEGLGAEVGVLVTHRLPGLAVLSTVTLRTILALQGSSKVRGARPGWDHLSAADPPNRPATPKPSPAATEAFARPRTGQDSREGHLLQEDQGRQESQQGPNQREDKRQARTPSPPRAEAAPGHSHSRCRQCPCTSPSQD